MRSAMGSLPGQARASHQQRVTDTVPERCCPSWRQCPGRAGRRTPLCTPQGAGAMLGASAEAEHPLGNLGACSSSALGRVRRAGQAPGSTRSPQTHPRPSTLQWWTGQDSVRVTGGCWRGVRRPLLPGTPVHGSLTQQAIMAPSLGSHGCL